MSEDLKYSEILIDYADPLLESNDSSDLQLDKLRTAQSIWNFCIAQEFGLKSFLFLNKIFLEGVKENPEFMKTFLMLRIRKKEKFNQHKIFIIDVYYNNLPDNTTTIKVEYCKPENFNDLDL
jgi:hypothetical protein